MSIPKLVEAFYARIWNKGDLAAADGLLSRELCFRGSLGKELRGLDAFKDYVRPVRSALADYNCEILDCVAEGNRAFAKMRFGGAHVAPFSGLPTHGKGRSLAGRCPIPFRK